MIRLLPGAWTEAPRPNTWTLTNGLHTISWTVTDTEGITEGIAMNPNVLHLTLCKLGTHDQALHALGKAGDAGYTVTEPLLHDPWVAPLRDNPRFIEILPRAQVRPDERAIVDIRLSHLEQPPRDHPL